MFNMITYDQLLIIAIKLQDQEITRPRNNNNCNLIILFFRNSTTFGKLAQNVDIQYIQ